MAWAGTDAELREQLRVKLSALRIASYAPLNAFRQLAIEVKHPEKGPFLIAAADKVTDYIDDLERQLNR